MCGRFSVVLKEKDLKDEFNFEVPPDFTYESYNIAPSKAVPIIHLDKDQKRQLSLMQWGFLPSWAKDHKEILRPINARLETVDSSPMFKNLFKKEGPLFRSRGSMNGLKEALSSLITFMNKIILFLPLQGFGTSGKKKPVLF